MVVYIKDKVMPISCFNCDYNICKEYCAITRTRFDKDLQSKMRLNNCQLVEVKSPHGRLIDADELESNYNDALYKCDYVAGAFDEVLSKTKTVIKAQGNETQGSAETQSILEEIEKIDSKITVLKEARKKLTEAIAENKIDIAINALDNLKTAYPSMRIIADLPDGKSCDFLLRDCVIYEDNNHDIVFDGE